MAKTRKKKQSDTIHIDINSHNAKGTKYKALSEMKRGPLNASDLKDGTQFFYDGLLHKIIEHPHLGLIFHDELGDSQGFLVKKVKTGFYVQTWFWNKWVKTFIKYKSTLLYVNRIK